MGETAHHSAGAQGDRPRRPAANRLWSERLASRLGFDRVGAALGRRWLAPYLLFGAVYVLDIPVLSTIRYLRTGYHPFLANPSVVLIPALAVYAIWSSRVLRDRYHETVAQLLPGETNGTADEHAIGTVRSQPSALERAVLRVGTRDTTDDRALVETLIAPRVKVVLLFISWGLYASWLLFNPDVLRIAVQYEGVLIGGIKYGLMIPFYLVLATEFVATYLGIIVFLPIKIRAVGIIDFQDPLGFGGLRPVGDIVRRATTYYLVGFAAYVSGIGLGQILARARFVPEIGAVTTAFIAAGSVLGVVLFVFPIVVLHGHMKGAKHEKINALASQVQQYGPEDDPYMFPETSLPGSAESGTEYVHLYIKMRKVENTREYPIDVSHLQELVLAAIVPYLAHVTVTFLLSTTGGGH